MLRLEGIEQIVGFLLLFTVLGCRSGFLPAPAFVSVVSAIVGVPAQNVPKLGPRQLRSTTYYAGGQQPRPCTPRSIQLILRQHAKVKEETLYPRDPQPRCPDMTALPTEGPAL